MKYIKQLIFLTMLLLASCQTTEKLKFHGTTLTVAHPKNIETLQGYSIALEGVYTGPMFAYDGMLVFHDDRHPDGFLYLFDVETGKRINTIGKKGQGPNEFVSFLFYGGFEKGLDGTYLWVNDFLKNNIILFSTRGERVKEINTSKFKSTNDYGIGAFHVLNDSLLLAYVQPYELFENNVVSPSWNVFNYKTGKTINEFKPYGDYRVSGEWNRGFFPLPDDLLASFGAIKPDKGKLIEAMFFLKRVDILNLESGKSMSITTKDAPILNLVTLSNSIKELHYVNPQCDDHYIYVMEINGNRTSGKINVFDWEGNFVCILRIKDDTLNFAFDPIRRILYAKNDADDVTGYDLGFLYK